MKNNYLILFILCYFSYPFSTRAQDSVITKTSTLVSRFEKSISERTGKLVTLLDKKSEKTLRRFKKNEARILKKLYRTDSIAARNFAIVSTQKFSELQQRISVPAPLRRYIPSLDTLTTSLKYLKQTTLGSNADNINKAISSVKELTTGIKNGEDLKQYLKEEKTYIKEQLEKFGVAKELKKINKDLYYYSEELTQIKETIGDEKKIERKILSLLNRSDAFREFITKHGMLGELLSAGGGAEDLASANTTGLQTRSGINQMIQDQIAAGGPNAQNVLNANLQQGQAQLQQLKTKLHDRGNKGSEDIMPEGFTPNDQKTKSFLKRLEFNTNLQPQQANSYLPVAMDFGLGVGYRLSSSGIIGIGASYKMGLGEHIQRIRISHQGVGIRSFIDWKFPVKVLGLKEGKGAWWISGGYEQNYMAAFKRIEELRAAAAWKTSGLIGISKSFSFNTKLFKGTKLQFLWDFLSPRQIPKTSPILFRVGYSLK